MRKALLLLAITAATLTSYAQAGSLNPHFGTNGIATTNFGKSSPRTEKVVSVLTQSGGRLLAVMTVNGNTVLGRYNADGSLDADFGGGTGYQVLGSFVATAVAQANGNIVLVGQRSGDANQSSSYSIIRLSTGGQFDAAFGWRNIQFSFNFVATAIAIQADEKIVVGGYTSNRFAVIRYQKDGALDSGFAVNGKDSLRIGDQAQANAMALQKDGKILLAGWARDKQGATYYALARYTAVGMLDTSFAAKGIRKTYFLKGNDAIYALAIQDDQKIIAAGYSQDTTSGYAGFSVARYTANGVLDKTFSGDGKTITQLGKAAAANALVLQADGKIVAAGYTDLNDHLHHAALVRYNSAGTLDHAFAVDGTQIVTGESSEQVTALGIQEDGKLIIGVEHQQDGDTNVVLARYTKNGTLDNSFSNDGRQAGIIITDPGTFSVVAVQDDGKIVVAGTWSDNVHALSNFVNFAIARFNTNGSLDNTFSVDGKQVTGFPLTDFGEYYNPAAGVVHAIAIQPDGKILVAGGISNDMALVRYNTDGSPDSTFNRAGIITRGFVYGDELYCDDVADNVLVQKDGKIFVIGHSCDNQIVLRYNPDGSRDATFGRFGGVLLNRFSSVTLIQPDGKIVMAGGAIIARYNANSTVDSTFGISGQQTIDATSIGTITGIHIQADGKLLISGSNGLVRLNPDGTFDNTFAGNGIITNEPAAVAALQPDGKLLVVQDSRISRYTVDGTLDSRFGKNGRQMLDLKDPGTISNLYLQTDGKLLAIGSKGLARLNSNGSLDSTFSDDGVQLIDFGRNTGIIATVMHHDHLYVTGSNTTYDPTVGAEVYNPLVADYQLGNNAGVRNWYRDADSDGWGNPDSLKYAVTKPAGYVADNNTDCNDTNKNVHPGAIEICDGLDNNCDGQVDEGVLKTFYSDYDGDGYGSPKRFIQACVAPPHYISRDGDCNDNNATVYPGAPERCDGLDNDCNGKIDDGLPQKPFYWDHDKDGYGFKRPVYACSAPPGYISIGGDFNDNDPTIHPGAVEHCDGIDEDCDGVIDNGFPQKRFYKDRDGDGWGSNSNLMAGCAPPGYVSKWGDCNDYNAAVHPGAAEVLGNGIDDNCNGQVDEITGCPSKDIVVNSEAGKCGAVVNWKEPSIANSCPTRDHEIEGFAYLGALNGHEYYRSYSKVTWHDANAGAIEAGGHLVTINSKEENDFIYKAIYDNVDLATYWIGLTDAAEEGHFVWSNGEPVTYTNWSKGEPNNGAGYGEENYAAMLSFTNGFWFDGDGAEKQGFILEIEPCVPVKLVQTSSPTTNLHNSSFFPVGTTTITYQAKDAHDSVLSTCSFDVIVNSTADDGCSMLTKNKAAEINLPKSALQLTAIPNPSTHYFTLHLQSNSNKPMLLRITDVAGRVVEMRQGIMPHTTIVIGNNYRPGVYFAEAMQAGRSVITKLVKTNQ